jgi:nicotinate-nucleotide pyrophosphorylase (carboxylating)
METPEVPRERRILPRTITPLTLPAASGVGILRFPLKPQATQELVRSALQEDAAFNDLTTIATVVSNRRSRATLVARQTGVVCGLPLALEAFRLLDAKATFRIEHEDGARVKAGEPVLFVTGHARGLLSPSASRSTTCSGCRGLRRSRGVMWMRCEGRTRRFSTRAKRRLGGERWRSMRSALGAERITGWI